MTDAEAAAADDVGPWLPAASATEFALSCATSVPAPTQVAVTVMVVPDVVDGVKVQPVAVPVFVKLDDDRPETDSLKVNVYEAESEFVLEIVAVDHDAVGGVVSATETVTVIDCVPPPRVV